MTHHWRTVTYSQNAGKSISQLDLLFFSFVINLFKIKQLTYFLLLVLKAVCRKLKRSRIVCRKELVDTRE